jgi:hypothetical protein
MPKKEKSAGIKRILPLYQISLHKNVIRQPVTSAVIMSILGRLKRAMDKIINLQTDFYTRKFPSDGITESHPAKITGNKKVQSEEHHLTDGLLSNTTCKLPGLYPHI